MNSQKGKEWQQYVQYIMMFLMCQLDAEYENLSAHM